MNLHHKTTRFSRLIKKLDKKGIATLRAFDKKVKRVMFDGGWSDGWDTCEQRYKEAEMERGQKQVDKAYLNGMEKGRIDGFHEARELFDTDGVLFKNNNSLIQRNNSLEALNEHLIAENEKLKKSNEKLIKHLQDKEMKYLHNNFD